MGVGEMPLQLAPLLTRHAEARRVENTPVGQGVQQNAAGEARQHGRRKFGTALSMSALNVQTSPQGGR